MSTTLTNPAVQETRRAATSPAPRDVWNRVAAADPNTLVTQTPAWTEAVTASSRWIDASRWYTTPDGRHLVLPMVRRGPRPFVTQTSFGEGWGFGGILAEGGVQSSDVALVVADLHQDPALRTTIRINPLLADRWKGAGTEITSRPRSAHVLDLSGGPDVVWNERMSGSGRRGVRRAQKSEVEVELDTAGRSLGVFHDLLVQSFERWAQRSNEPVWLARHRGTRRDPLKKFEIMADRLGEGFRLYIARHEGRAAAAIVVLAGQNYHYTRGAMDAKIGGKVNANDLLHWTAIQDACAAGSPTYHMGESRPGSSLATYKEKFGARPFRYAEYIVERLPITRIDGFARGIVKRAIRFRDV